MSELIININLDNAAFGDSPEEEVARILENYAKSVKEDGELNDKYSFKDFNGNQVGEAKVVEYPEGQDRENYTDDQDRENYTESEQETEKQRIVIGIEGGMIQWIGEDITEELDIVVVDWDAGNDCPLIKDSLGHEHPANLYKCYDVFDDKEAVNNYFDQLED